METGFNRLISVLYTAKNFDVVDGNLYGISILIRELRDGGTKKGERAKERTNERTSERAKSKSLGDGCATSERVWSKCWEPGVAVLSRGRKMRSGPVVPSNE